MTCDHIKELLVEYWDIPADDIKRKQLHDHIKHCESCAEEYAIWQESIALIKSSSPQIELTSKSRMSNVVMSRIYADEGWREPIPNRIYSISYKSRRKLTLLIAFFLALFTVSFLYLLISKPAPEPAFDGLIPVASAVGDSSVQGIKLGANLQGVPVASISDPFVLGMNSFESHPDYLVVIALIGVICTLLIMNWFSRIKA